MDSNLIRRIAVAVVAIPLAIALTWYGSWPFVILVAVITVLGTREVLTLAGHSKVEGFPLTASIAAGALPVLSYAALTDNPFAMVWTSGWRDITAIWLMVIIFLALRYRTKAQQPLAAAAITVFAVLYAAALPTYLIEIRHALWPVQSWPGTALVFFPLVVTWVCDTAAMFGGRMFGGPKLATEISPAKTRSGAISGIVAGVLVAPIFTIFVFPSLDIPITLLPAMLVALVLAVVGQSGDLAESLFKRAAGVKDSSALIPGHGGILDRFDSLYFVIPTAAICYRLLGLL